MAVHRGNKKYRHLDMSSERNLRKYAHFIQQKIGVNLNSFAKLEIENALDNLHHLNEDTKHLFIKEMARDCDSSLLGEEEFTWLKNNVRACNWTWLALKSMSSEALVEMSNPSETDNSRFHPTPIFDHVVTLKQVSSTTERYSEIIEYFDLRQSSISEKQNLLNSLKSIWAEMTPHQIELKWLDNKNDEQCSWAWTYILNSYISTENLTPITLTDEYDSIYASLDFWNAHPDSKILFCQKLKKAWDQKVFRKKQGNKVPLNTYITKEARDMLRLLSQDKDQKMHETLEEIINNAFNRY